MSEKKVESDTQLKPSQKTEALSFQEFKWRIFVCEMSGCKKIEKKMNYFIVKTA